MRASDSGSDAEELEQHPTARYLSASTDDADSLPGRRRRNAPNVDHTDLTDPLSCKVVRRTDRSIDFIRPYTLDTQLPWEHLSLERTPFLHGQYKDKLVAAEFLRFVHRDIAFALLPQLYFAGVYLFVIANMLNAGVMGPFALAAGTAALAGVIIEFALHVFFVHDRSNGFFRFANSWMLMIAQVLVTSVHIAHAGHHCADGFFLSEVFFDRPELTDVRVQKRCVEILSIMPAATAMSCVNAYRLIPYVALIALVVQTAMEVASRFIDVDISREPTVFLIIKGLVTVGYVSGSVGMIYLRHSLVKRQFEQTVALHLATVSALRKEREVDTLLATTLPESALNRLSRGEAVVDTTAMATVLFSDMVAFTKWSSTRTSAQVASMLNDLCSRFDEAAAEGGVEKIKTIGDAYWAVCGLPHPVIDHAYSIVRFGEIMNRIAAVRSRANPEWGDIRLRIGVHSGPLAGGVLGTQQLSYEVFGTTNAIAQLVEQQGVPGTVTMTSVTNGLLEDIGLPLERDLDIDVSLPDSRTLTSLSLFTMPKTRGDTGMGSLHGSSGVASPRASSSQKSTARESSGLGQDARRNFLKSRKAKRQSESNNMVNVAEENEAEQLETLVERYTTRRYAWVFQGLANDEAEAEYAAFVKEELRAMHVAARGAVAIGAVLCMVCLGIEGAAVHPAVWCCFALAAAVSAVTTGLCSQALLPRVDLVLAHVAPLLLITGVGLINELFVDYAVIANDPTWVYTVASFSMTFATIGTVPSAVQLALHVCLFWPPMLFFMLASVLLAMNVITATLILIAVVFICIAMERHARLQFLDGIVATFYAQEAERRHGEQEALLASIVPRRIIAPLMDWMSSDFDPAYAVSRHYEASCVGFVAFRESNSVDVLTIESEGASNRLFQLHRRVDQLLGGAVHVEKIKTIGDVVMLGGPFAQARPDADALAVAARELLRFFERMLEGDEEATVRAGAHVGEVQGIVLGSARLCFDVFGDTVNVASRVLTSAKAHGATTAVSHAFFNLVSQCQDVNHRNTGNGDVGASTLIDAFNPDPVAVTAKGKGDLLVHMRDGCHRTRAGV